MLLFGKLHVCIRVAGACLSVIFRIITSLQLTCLIVIHMCTLICSANISIAKNTYKKYESNRTLVTSQQRLLARSLTDCLQFCATKNTSCGANVEKGTFGCTCLFEEDFIRDQWVEIANGVVYVRSSCDNMVQVECAHSCFCGVNDVSWDYLIFKLN